MADIQTAIEVLVWLSLACLTGGFFLWLLSPKGADDDPNTTDPPVEAEAGAGASASSVSRAPSEGRRFQIVRPADRLAVIHRRRQQRASRLTRH
jgi:hypothetical protein